MFTDALLCIAQARLQSLVVIWVRIFSVHAERLSNSDWHDMAAGMALKSMLDGNDSTLLELRAESFGQNYEAGTKSDRFPWEFITIYHRILACALHSAF
jgi:hypothetical protein